MAASEGSEGGLVGRLEATGRATARGVDTFGFGATLVGQALYWLLLGRRHGQRVRPQPVFAEMMEIGIRAIPIVTASIETIGIARTPISIISEKTGCGRTV